MDFFVLGGDANRDKVVDTLDFNVLAANFGTSAKTFSKGNFSYDVAGVVDTLDFNILAANFGKSLPSALASNSLVAPASATAKPVAFSVTRIGDDSLIDDQDVLPS